MSDENQKLIENLARLYGQYETVKADDDLDENSSRVLQEAGMAVFGGLKIIVEALKEMGSRDYWLWDSAGENRLESITCPVLIRAEDLRQLLSRPTPPTPAFREIVEMFAGFHGGAMPQMEFVKRFGMQPDKIETLEAILAKARDALSAPPTPAPQPEGDAKGLLADLKVAEIDLCEWLSAHGDDAQVQNALAAVRLAITRAISASTPSESERVLRDEIDALAKFKTYVHTRLDQQGIPHGDPDNQHQKEGCRIGARLDLVFAERDALRAQLAEAQQWIDSEPDWKDQYNKVLYQTRQRIKEAEGHLQDIEVAATAMVNHLKSLGEKSGGLDLIKQKITDIRTFLSLAPRDESSGTEGEDDESI